MKVVFSGGLNENQYPSIFEAAKGSYNFTLSKDSTALKPRAPFDLKGTAPNAGNVGGLMQLITRANAVTTLVQAANTIYSWDGASTFTSVGTCATSSQLRDVYWSLNDYIVITDLTKQTVVQKWTGSGTVTNITTGLGVDLYAKYAVVWRNRTWLFNVKTSTDTPHLFVASAFENPQSYDITLRATHTSFTSGNEAFYMLSPDLRPINGACVFYDQLIVSTEGGKLFRVTGTDSTNYAVEEFYPQSNAIGPDSLVNGGDDIFYMKQGGAIESLISTQRFGDIQTDDLSRYIPDSTSGLTSCYSVYDQEKQTVNFFTGEKVLVLHKNLLKDGGLIDNKGSKVRVSPWSVYKTQHASGFSTSAVKYLRIPGGTAYSVYFGDSSGRVFDLNGTGLSGDGGTSAIQVNRSTRVITAEDGKKLMRHVTRGTIEFRRMNQVSVSIDLDWSDEYASSTANVTLNGATALTIGAYFGGSIYFSGSSYFSQGFEFLDRVSHKNFSSVGKGPGCILTVTTEDNLSYQIENITLD